jgi:glycosyltransferase involved in cell wall biosynthesis
VEVKPRIAVVVPCFNDGELAREAVASVREAEPVEIVVVNDGSSERATLRALAEIAASGAALVIHTENGGLAQARMRGVAVTQAPFIQPLDADDRLPAGVLGAMADLLERTPEAAFCYGDYLVFGDYEGRYRAPERFSPWALTYGNFYCGCSLVRRSALEDVGGWDFGPAYEDWDLWLKFVEAGWSAVRWDGVAYERRLHGERMLAAARVRHRQLYRELKRRHPRVWAQRSALRRVERPSLRQRLLYPILLGERRFVPARLESWLKKTLMHRALRV